MNKLNKKECVGIKEPTHSYEYLLLKKEKISLFDYFFRTALTLRPHQR